MLSHGFLQDLWYGKHILSLLLAPLGWFYAGVMLLRRMAYASGILPVQRVSVPVIVVGNISVGGTGKTPLIIWLTDFLKKQGYKPGVISRGYGGTTKEWPQQVRPDSNPLLAGDEPVLIAQRTGVPVAISPNRYVAAVELIQHANCDVLLCDDGLQHHALHRDLEIAVIDGDRDFGNGRCLPAGPLREPPGRLDSVDMIVNNGNASKHQYLMEFLPSRLRSLKNKTQECEIEDFSGQRVHGVAGIGNPNRFFSMLQGRQISVIRHAFPDHYRYHSEDLDFGDDLPVLMTEKDAVKCMSMTKENFWYLPIEAKMTNAFEHRLTILMKEIVDGQ